MTSAFPAELEQDYEKTKDESRTKLNRVQKEGELAGTVSFQFYKGTYDVDKKQMVELDKCPATVMKTGKPKKDGGKATQYKAVIPLVTRLESMSPIKGTCEVTGDGRYKVLAKVQYLKSSSSGEELFSDWALRNCKQLYDEHDQTFDERTRSQLKNYISPAGEIVKETFIRLSPNSNITLKCNDDGAQSIFRQKLDNTSLQKVRRHTKLNLTKIEVISWIYMKNVGKTEAGKILYVPHATYWLKPGKVELAPGEEHYKSIAAKMRENETPEQHLMAHPPAVANGSVKIPMTAYFLVRNNYSTSVPVQNPDRLGVSIKVDPAEKPEDVCYTDQDLNKIKIINRSLAVYQWKGSIMDGYKKYRVQIKGPRDEGKMAEKYGILDTEDYGRIMFAHHDVTHHAICGLWWGATFKNSPDNTEDALARDTTGCAGYYKYGYEDIIPDYYLYFEEDNGAIQISREMCAELFGDYVGEVKRTGATQLTLRSMAAVNPVNVDGAQSEVLLLGRPDRHTYNGDAWPAISNGRVYVMTSHMLNAEERSTLCGRNADTDAADKRFKELLQIPGFTYMVFVVQAPAVNVSTTTPSPKKKKKPKVEEEEEPEPTPPPAPKKNKKKKPKVEEQEEEEPKEEEPMDISEELEDDSEIIEDDDDDDLEEEEEEEKEEDEEEEEPSPPPAPRKKKTKRKKTPLEKEPRKKKTKRK